MCSASLFDHLFYATISFPLYAPLKMPSHEIYVNHIIFGNLKQIPMHTRYVSEDGDDLI